MHDTGQTASSLWLLLLFFASALVLLGVLLALSSVLGQRHRERATGEPYESGMTPTGSARVRFDIRFYLVAMFFLIFDVEAVFLYAWAISAREAGWAGYLEALIFIAVLFTALVYLWKMGALDWGGKGRASGRVTRRTGCREQKP